MIAESAQPLAGVVDLVVLVDEHHALAPAARSAQSVVCQVHQRCNPEKKLIARI
jgi:hypothetical protein